jgi:translation initiation factor eIF-2B subunit delta
MSQSTSDKQPPNNNNNNNNNNNEQTNNNKRKQQQNPMNIKTEKPKKTNEELRAEKAERRRVQEEQRLAKGQRPQGGGNNNNNNSITTNNNNTTSSSSINNSSNKSTNNNNTITTTNQPSILRKQPLPPATVSQNPNRVSKIVSRTESQKKVQLFSHLRQVEREGSLTKNVCFMSHSRGDATGIHPSVITLGVRYSEGVIRGADARALGMLQAFTHVVRDFSPPLNESFSRSLTKRLSAQFDFLTSCRPHSITMGNAFVHLKQVVSKIAVDSNEEDARKLVLNTIDDFIKTSIVAAADEVAVAGVKHISDGDVILTYARSSVVEKTFFLAHSMRKNFTVIVIDSRPTLEGLELFKRLSRAGIKCQFGALAALSYILQGVDVTKVFLGAGALLSNGAVLARAGTAMVATMAHTRRRPVLVFAESYKFSERVHLDSVVFNELGDPEDLLLRSDSTNSELTPMVESKDPLVDWRDQVHLTLLNLTYDVTQSEYVDMIVTELGNLPPSSVPVIIRERKEGGGDGRV